MGNGNKNKREKKREICEGLWVRVWKVDFGVGTKGFCLIETSVLGFCEGVNCKSVYKLGETL